MHRSPSTRHAPFSSAATGALFLSSLLLGCGDSDAPTGPGTGSDPGAIRVTISTSGETPDPDGYTLVIEGVEERAVSDGTLDVPQISAGSRNVRLDGLAPNCSVDGDNPRTLTVASGVVAATTFSVRCPRALLDAIVFQTDRTGDLEIFSLAADGTAPENLTGDPATDWLGTVSPDGTQILIDTERNGNREIFVANADGSGLKNLTNQPFAEEAVPSWSPDGTRIVFESGRDGDLEVYVMNADGSGQTNLTNAPAFQDRFATWTPDGTRILFTTNRDGNNEIYSMRPDGSDLTNLTNHPAEDFLGIMSPDGTRIAFTRRTATETDVWVMDADGSGQTNLTNDPAIDELPDWSPDGTRLVFASTRSGNFDLWIMDADGTDPWNLTETPDSGESAPRWSPAGDGDLDFEPPGSPIPPQTARYRPDA